MFYNAVLDVFTGLIFVFLLYSLLATILQEIIARWLNLRARMLQKALRRMLEDDDGEITDAGLSVLGRETYNLFHRFFYPIKKDSLLAKFYNHPTIKYLGQDKLFSKPSYLHAHNFSQTIIHLLRGETYDGRAQNESELIWKELNENKLGINTETLKTLKNLFADVRQDSYLFKSKLEDWFEETMERTSGWYKKQTQIILILIGFSLAVAFNVDTIAISKILMKDKKVREQIVQLAISHQQQYGNINDSLRKIKVTRSVVTNGDTTMVSYDSLPPVTDKFLETTYNDLTKNASEAMGILGLRAIPEKSDSVLCDEAVSYYDSLINKASTEEQRKRFEKEKTRALKDCLAETRAGSPYQRSWFLIFIGWLLTALAVSLGAPFWFDLLNKFIRLRESGPKPTNTSLLDKPGTAPSAGNPVKANDNKEISG